MAAPDFNITEKVQLHIHLDGSVRLGSVISMAGNAGVTLPASTLKELVEKVEMKKPETLTTFLARFAYFIPAISGNLTNIRRLAKEFAEDMANDNCVYTEARFCPHLLIGDSSLTPDDIVSAVCDEFKQAEKRHKIMLRVILCCMRHMPEISLDLARLCIKYKDQGVVAIDIAGDENAVESTTPTQQEHFDAFKLAKDNGIFRTVHAGENGSYRVVVEALDKMWANRIGHGYHSVEDATLYARIKTDDIHLECCPYSSIMTGAANPDWKQHTCLRFVKDDMNFGLNTDDPTITATTLTEEYKLAEEKMGISRIRLLKTVFDAARSTFASDADKATLIKRLKDEYKKVPGADKF